MDFIPAMCCGLGCQGGGDECGGAVSAAAAKQEPGVQNVARLVLSAQRRLWLCWVDTAALQWQEPAEDSPSQWAPHHPLLGVLWISLHIGEK